jgi:hypothetical protein
VWPASVLLLVGIAEAVELRLVDDARGRELVDRGVDQEPPARIRLRFSTHTTRFAPAWT